MKGRLPSLARMPWGFAQHRDITKFLADAAGWQIGLALATWARLEFNLGRIDWSAMVLLGLAAAAVQWVTGRVTGLYIGRYRYGGFDEIGALSQAVAATTLVTFVANDLLPGDRLVPRGAALVAGALALVVTAGIRYTYRFLLEVTRRPSGSNVQRLLVFGSGDGAYQAVTAMVHDPKSPYLPVGLLDDNLDRRNRRLAGVPVLGGRHDMAAAADRVEADALLIAIPSATSDLIAELSALARAIPLTVMVLPPVAELFGGRITVEDIHRVTPEDLLGRHQVQTDVESIAGYVTGKRVLVTGAGGSIGSELSRQLHRFGPAELLLLDRDESALHGVELSIQGRALLDSRDLVLMDIRDRNGLARLFAEREPEVVFHAAALKHLPLLERHPSEAVKTNVWGTLALLEAAARSGVDRFVNISTDKAADPESVLGYSKRICERLTAEMAARTGQPFLSVRFGNVLGSRGSVLETFHRQVERGGPVTVTHPDVTRFFMTIEEAVQLVIQAGAIGAGGEVLVLDMGEPVKILDVAEMLAAQSDRPIEIVFTGLRPGEKLHERLSAIGETGGRPMHPLIQHVPVPPLPVGLVQALDPAADGDLTIELLRRLAVDDNRIDLTERSFGRV